MLTREHIVVGVSRTPSGAVALRWAIDTAVAQGWELLAVHSFDIDLRSDARLDRDQHAEARASARRAQLWVQMAAKDDEARRLLQFRSCIGRVEDVLAEQSVGATLLVIGTPILAQHADIPEQLRKRCSCPVILVNDLGSAVMAGGSFGFRPADLPESVKVGWAR